MDWLWGCPSIAHDLICAIIGGWIVHACYKVRETKLKD